MKQPLNKLINSLIIAICGAGLVLTSCSKSSKSSNLSRAVESGSEVKSVKQVDIPNRIKTYEEYRQALDAFRQQYHEEVEGIERERIEKCEELDKKYKENFGLLMQKHPELGDLYQLMSEEYGVHEAQVAAKRENCFRIFDANQAAIGKAYETYGEDREDPTLLFT
jgi:hypothetical protein